MTSFIKLPLPQVQVREFIMAKITRPEASGGKLRAC